MKAASSGSFEATLKALERALHVGHIATFELKCCEPGDSVADVLQNDSFRNLDHVPVGRDGNIVGVLHRTAVAAEGDVGSKMKAVHEVCRVAPDTPLMTFLREAKDEPFALVFDGPDVIGIVTRSDLQKLPVRLLVFALITHLETQMADLIRAQCCPLDEKWFERWIPKRESALTARWKELKKKSEELDVVAVTEFFDKREVIKGLKLWDEKEMAEFETDLGRIATVRNPVAHARSVDSAGWIAHVLAAERWIGRFDALHAEPGELTEPPAPAFPSSAE